MNLLEKYHLYNILFNSKIKYFIAEITTRNSSMSECWYNEYVGKYIIIKSERDTVYQNCYHLPNNAIKKSEDITVYKIIDKDNFESIKRVSYDIFNDIKENIINLEDYIIQLKENNKNDE